jgi:hypothetical protein
MLLLNVGNDTQGIRLEDLHSHHSMFKFLVRRVNSYESVTFSLVSYLFHLTILSDNIYTLYIIYPQNARSHLAEKVSDFLWATRY